MSRRSLRVFALLLISTLLGALSASHAQILPPPPPGFNPCAPPPGHVAIYNTGVDNCGNLLADQAVDPHYIILGLGAAFVVINGRFPLDGNWLADGPNSKWIAPSPTGSGPQFSSMDYQTTFDLSHFDLSTVKINGSWATDNEGLDILLNGQSLGFTINPPDRAGFRSLVSFSISSGFVQGINTLDFIVHNDEGPTGFRAELSGTGQAIQTACGLPPFTGSQKSTIPIKSSNPANRWTMNFDASTDEGLVLSSIFLGGFISDDGVLRGVPRYMARKFSIPKYLLTTPSGTMPCKLAPSGTTSLCRSQLVDLSVDDQGNQFIVKAKYAIDRLPDDVSGNVCLTLTQQYQFAAEQKPTSSSPSVACEPSGTTPCAKFFPMVSYDFSDPSYNARITTAQRLEFVASPNTSPASSNSAAIFHDCNLDDPNPGCGVLPVLGGPILIPFITNPLNGDAIVLAILSGAAADWDNYHQTYKPRVDEPRFSPFSLLANATTCGFPGSPPGFPTLGCILNKAVVPGCIECVHVHWRWTDLAPSWGGPGGKGSPLIPPGSTQSVQIAVVQAGGANDDADVLASRFAQTFPGPLPFVGRLTNPVLWYGASSSAPSDNFFTHGGWYTSVLP